MNARSAGYWTTTTLTALALLTGGAAYLSGADVPVRGVAELGYPAYFVTILGTWKVLGGLAILAPRLPRLKEWAYAGITFELTGGGILAGRDGRVGREGDRAARAPRDRRCIMGSPACEPHARRRERTHRRSP